MLFQITSESFFLAPGLREIEIKKYSKIDYRKINNEEIMKVTEVLVKSHLVADMTIT